MGVDAEISHLRLPEFRIVTQVSVRVTDGWLSNDFGVHAHKSDFLTDELWSFGFWFPVTHSLKSGHSSGDQLTQQIGELFMQ